MGTLISVIQVTWCCFLPYPLSESEHLALEWQCYLGDLLMV